MEWTRQRSTSSSLAVNNKKNKKADVKPSPTKPKLEIAPVSVKLGSPSKTMKPSGTAAKAADESAVHTPLGEPIFVPLRHSPNLNRLHHERHGSHLEVEAVGRARSGRDKEVQALVQHWTQTTDLKPSTVSISLKHRN